MRILDRYLIRSFLTPFFYCLLLFVLLFTVIDAFNNLDEFLKQGVQARLIVAYYLYSMPAILVQGMPICILVAVLYNLGHFARHNEITAMKASGVSAGQILVPYLFVGLIASFLVFLANEHIVPPATVTSKTIMEKLIASGKTERKDNVARNVTLYGFDKRLIYAREFDIPAQTMYDVVIMQDTNQKLRSKLIAKKARYEEGKWKLNDVMRYELSPRGEMIGELDYLLSMSLEMPETPQDFLKQGVQLEDMNARQLKDYIERMGGLNRKHAERLWVDFNYKIAFPFVCFIVVLVGSPLAMRTRRGSVAIGISTSLVITLLYYGMASLFLALGKGGLLPPAASAWMSNIFFAGLGIYLIKKTA